MLAGGDVLALQLLDRNWRRFRKSNGLRGIRIIHSVSIHICNRRRSNQRKWRLATTDRQCSATDVITRVDVLALFCRNFESLIAYLKFRLLGRLACRPKHPCNSGYPPDTTFSSFCRHIPPCSFPRTSNSIPCGRIILTQHFSDSENDINPLSSTWNSEDYAGETTLLLSLGSGGGGLRRSSLSHTGLLSYASSTVPSLAHTAVSL